MKLYNLFGTFSHEIRTPLNGILGIITLLYETKLNEEQKEYLDLVRESSYSLLAIVNDILDLDSLETNQLKLNIKSFNLKKLVEKNLNIIKQKNVKNLKISVHFGNNIPNYFKGDPQRITQIIFNLLQNSLKFTSKGFIKFETTYSEDLLYFTCYDSGIGGLNPDKNKDFIFERSNLDEGYGLGLILCKKLCLLMNGDITIISSEINKGTVIKFWLPLELSETIENDNFLSIVKNKKVLLVDDNISNRLSICSVLEKYQMMCIPTSTLRESLIISKNIQFDIGLIDMYLNDKQSGIDVANNLRNNGYTFPLIALSSLGTKTPYYIKHFKYHLSKPIKDSLLIEYISKTLNSQETNEIVNQNIKILVADDVEINQKVVRGFLLNLHYHNFTIVNNGYEVLNLINSGNHFDIIFLDIKMPYSGYLTLKNINEHYKNKKRPICVALSGTILKESNNFDAFLQKPCTIQELQNILKKFF